MIFLDLSIPVFVNYFKIKKFLLYYKIMIRKKERS